MNSPGAMHFLRPRCSKVNHFFDTNVPSMDALLVAVVLAAT